MKTFLTYASPSANLLLASLIPVMSACVMLPVGDPVVEGQRRNAAELSFLQKNQTPKSEVIAKLGSPTLWLASQRIAVYGVTTKQEYSGFWFLWTARDIGASVTRGEALFVAFDDTERVINWGFSKIPLRTTWLGTALDWARSEGLQVPEPRAKFDESPIPEGRSLVYFLRPKNGLRWPGFETFPIVYADGRSMLGEVRDKTYLAVLLEPGPHRFTVVPLTRGTASSVGVAESSIQLDLRPGSAYFVDLYIRVADRTFVVDLRELSRDDALPTIRALQETWQEFREAQASGLYVVITSGP